MVVYRYLIHVQVKQGKFREFLSLLEEWNAAFRAKGLAPCVPWAPTVGPVNGAILIWDYDSLDAFDRDSRGRMGDEASQDIARQFVELEDGAPWTELWETDTGPVA